VKIEKIMENIDYYINRLNNKKRTGHLFNIIPFPNIAPIYFQIGSIVLFAILGAIIKLPISTFLLICPIIWDHYYTSHLRNKIIEECLVSEYLFEEDFKKGPDPNFPNDPLYVTQDDRDGIFDDAWHIVVNSRRYNDSKKIIKEHSLYLIPYPIALPILFYLFLCIFNYQFLSLKINRYQHTLKKQILSGPLIKF
jgi:uncharacterized membrane protein